MPINKTHQKTFDPHATPTPSLCLVIFVYLLISMPRHLYLSSCRGPKFTESLFPMFLVIKFWHQYWHWERRNNLILKIKDQNWLVVTYGRNIFQQSSLWINHENHIAFLYLTYNWSINSLMRMRNNPNSSITNMIRIPFLSVREAGDDTKQAWL